MTFENAFYLAQILFCLFCIPVFRRRGRRRQAESQS